MCGEVRKRPTDKSPGLCKVDPCRARPVCWRAVHPDVEAREGREEALRCEDPDGSCREGHVQDICALQEADDGLL